MIYSLIYVLLYCIQCMYDIWLIKYLNYHSPMTIYIKAEPFPWKVIRLGVTELYIIVCMYVCMFVYI